MRLHLRRNHESFNDNNQRLADKYNRQQALEQKLAVLIEKETVVRNELIHNQKELDRMLEMKHHYEENIVDLQLKMSTRRQSSSIT